MNKRSNIIGYLNLIGGILNICKFLYYMGHYNDFLWANLSVGIFTIIIGISLLKS